jgi:type IV pilus assembly protein PilY1
MHGMMHMTRKNVHIGSKFLSSLAISSGILLAALDAQATVSQSPLSLTIGVPPNLILTLDDSGSMFWGHVPDYDGSASTTVTNRVNAVQSTRRIKSSTFNPMYYNPTVTYSPPPRFNSDGSSYSPTAAETPTFTQGLSNPFKASYGYFNLAHDYRVTWTYNYTSNMLGTTVTGQGNTSNRFARNPESDFKFPTFAITSTGGSLTKSQSGISVTVTRTGKTAECTATASYTDSSSNLPVRCTGSGTNFTVDLSTEPALKSGEQNFSSGSKTVSIEGIDLKITRTGTRTCTATASTKGGSQNKPTDCYSRANNIFEATYSGVPAYYYSYNAGTSGCAADSDTDKAKESCYTLNFVPDSQQQNFANWYSYYRTRALATISAASIAFAELDTSTRLTWQGVGTNKCGSVNSASSCAGKDNRFREFDQAQRGRLFTWMQQDMTSGDGTRLLRALENAGEFLKTETAWQKFPNASSGNTAENTYACRPSYHILMSDGMWNGTIAAKGKADHNRITLPDGTEYDGATHPFVDATTGTLADLAMHYWATDLLTSGNGNANKLTPFMPAGTDYWDPRNNPATWQHMVNFTVGLGLGAALQQEGIKWDKDEGAFGGAGYTNLKNGTNSWPATSDGSLNNAYDLWHTAINSRGDFFSADSPDAVVQAFRDIMSRIAARKSTASRPAMNSGQVAENEDDGVTIRSVSYQTTYDSEKNWSGDLIKREKTRTATTTLDPTTGTYNTTYEDGESTLWRASGQMPDAASRDIKIPTASGNSLQAFTWGNAGDPATEGTLAWYLNRNPLEGNVQDTKGQDRLDYLRGDRSLEGTSNDSFRQRTNVLGDLYSSVPVSVSKARYLINEGNRIEGNEAYSDFAELVKDRRGMVYVGGNDGMLHGFDSATGREDFAFIPSAVFPNLNKLTGTNYNHHFYVDGSPVVADVYDNGTWKTILVGTLRAGGKSVFALDVTDPDDIRLLWEFDDRSIGTNAVKMGYSFSKPTIARLNTGRWAVVFGNGYEAQDHTNGKAALFVLDAVTGSSIAALEVQGSEDVPNGLSTPKLSDYNADGIAEFAYAGDLQGNLWRFDLHSASASSFSVAYGGEPMFKSVSTPATETSPGQRQHITSAPSLVRHPTGNGYLVIFGTGKYFESGDKDGDKSMPQSLYGIWDRYTKLTAEDIAASSGSIEIDRNADLVAQTITQATSATNQAGQSLSARVISNNEVAWYDADGNINKLGWRLDFRLGTLDGEMVVDDMSTLGRSLFLQTLVPNDDPCADGASNWTYAINPHSGGRLRHNALILSAPTLAAGVFPSGQQQSGEGGLTIAQKPDGNFEVCTGTTCNDVRPDPSSIGRQTWRLVDETEE